MTTALKVAAFVGLLVAAWTSSAPAFGVGGVAGDVKAEEEIRAVYKEFVDAWNRHDAKAMGSMWAIDGDHQEPDGRVAKGRDDVTTLFVKQHESVFKTTKLDLKLDTVWLISGDVALIDGGYTVTGIRDLEGNELPSRSGHLTSVLLKEKDKWWIEASRLMIPTTLPYKKPDAAQ